jgi:hypothetical protein
LNPFLDGPAGILPGQPRQMPVFAPAIGRQKRYTLITNIIKAKQFMFQVLCWAFEQGCKSIMAILITVGGWSC